MKRILATLISVALVATLAVGGSIAYLTDTDSAVNVMTVGNVDIEQYETDAEGNAFEQKQSLYPAYYEGNDWNSATEITGAIEKNVNVKNVGTAEAYVRTLIAFEAGELTKADFDKYIHTTWATEPTGWVDGAITVKDVKYYVAYVDYGKVDVGAETADSLQTILMDKVTSNEIVVQFGDSYEILALTQAVQTSNVPDEVTAWNESFGAVTAENAANWFDGIEQIPVHTVSNADEFAAAIENGGSIILNDDIDMDDTMLAIPEGKAVFLDLNGHDLESDLSAYTGSHSALITVKKGASLTIEGEGNVHAVAAKTKDYVSAIVNNLAGDVTINGGTYTMENGTYAEGYLIPTIVDNNSNEGNANLTINGGTFYHNRNMFRNFSNAASHNGYASVATITINGGTFIASDGAAAIWNQKPSTSTPDGAGVVVINGGTFAGVTVDDDWNVIPSDPSGEGVTTATYAKNNDEFSDAISGGEITLILADGKYTLPAAVKDKTVTISGTKDTVIDVTNNLTYINGSEVTFDGVTIQSKPNAAGYENGFADGKYAIFNDCVINGTLGLDYSCEFNNCTFNIEGNYYNVWTWGAGTASFNGCTFNCDGKALLVYANVLDNGKNHQTVNITDCKFNDNGDDTVTGKAAIEITNTYTPVRTYDVNITRTTVNGFSQTVPGNGDFNTAYGSVAGSNIGTNVWGNKCKLPNTQINVVIDGVDVY